MTPLRGWEMWDRAELTHIPVGGFKGGLSPPPKIFKKKVCCALTKSFWEMHHSHEQKNHRIGWFHFRGSVLTTLDLKIVDMVPLKARQSGIKQCTDEKECFGKWNGWGKGGGRGRGNHGNSTFLPRFFHQTNFGKRRGGSDPSPSF